MPGVRSSGGCSPYAIARSNLFTGALMMIGHPVGARDRAVTRMRVAVAGALCATLMLTPVAAARKARRRPVPEVVSVTVNAGHPGATVPQDFLGLSFEASALPQIARDRKST